MHDEAFRKLLDHFNRPWAGYRKVRKGVKKRIARHMQTAGTVGMDDYLALIERDPEAGKDCEKLLSVSISRFFRDAHVWESLEKKILPALLDGLSYGEHFKAWSCGCARGEEAYSFSILWGLLENRRSDLPELELLATDMNRDYLEMAAEGIYERRSLKEMPETLRDMYFEKTPGKKTWRVKSSLKKKVAWKEHDFLRDPPPARGFHLIFARNNLLTYYRAPERDEAFARIVDSLKKNGAFIIGSHEKIPDGFSFMKRHPECNRIFLKDG